MGHEACRYHCADASNVIKINLLHIVPLSGHLIGYDSHSNLFSLSIFFSTNTTKRGKWCYLSLVIRPDSEYPSKPISSFMLINSRVIECTKEFVDSFVYNIVIFKLIASWSLRIEYHVPIFCLDFRTSYQK